MNHHPLDLLYSLNQMLSITCPNLPSSWNPQCHQTYTQTHTHTHSQAFHISAPLCTPVASIHIKVTPHETAALYQGEQVAKQQHTLSTRQDNTKPLDISSIRVGDADHPRVLPLAKPPYIEVRGRYGKIPLVPGEATRGSRRVRWPKKVER
jgi:hypothetical protein